MRTKLLFISVMLGILTTGCSRKVAPTISLPTEQNPCDSTIKALIDSISDVNLVYITETIYKDGEQIIDTICITDSSNCNYYKITALEIAAKYNSAIKERDFYKAIANSQAKKIINNNYVNSKNKNTQIGDGNTQQDSKSGTNQSGAGNVNQEVKKGPAQNGNDNVAAVKPKGSATGAGASTENNKKGSSWWAWLLVGYLGCHVIHKIIIPAAMRVIPFANLAGNIGKLLLKLKFW